jgi:hypothetical protein
MDWSGGRLTDLGIKVIRNNNVFKLKVTVEAPVVESTSALLGFLIDHRHPCGRRGLVLCAVLHTVGSMCKLAEYPTSEALFKGNYWWRSHLLAREVAEELASTAELAANEPDFATKPGLLVDAVSVTQPSCCDAGRLGR